MKYEGNEDNKDNKDNKKNSRLLLIGESSRTLDDYI